MMKVRALDLPFRVHERSRPEEEDAWHPRSGHRLAEGARGARDYVK